MPSPVIYKKSKEIKCEIKNWFGMGNKDQGKQQKYMNMQSNICGVPIVNRVKNGF